ncbi:hypothetical protein TVAG_440960 [Trichomonas vaginalis G3]|uniref:TPR repeat protein n=1 Tax=Trichomonas vaginalis (strain ATCC PRA-98 / G3) TaxID=412133 RepID=A2EXB8_TRIV3|nr:ERAD pathway [Trichomonas vaginalis G3]EAY02717.1 hypothetical protein TVAG_440960 [Trichomonas vaginalis G3]KAI5513495.1 ERAD pathway [Trichomonas vaginalis G3]|eukprot:XP_001314940.1 hypothetical protein [Trichomonas vaginalis G3]
MSDKGITSQTEEFLNSKIGRTVLKELETKAQAKDPLSMFRLGILYYNGKTVEQNIPQAIELFKNASSAGSPDAKLLLSTLYMKGENVPLDTKTAYNLVEEAAGANIPEAQHILAQFLYEGKYCAKNVRRAARNFNAAIPLENPMDSYMVGKIMEEDDSEEPIYSKILGYYQRAANQNYLDAITATARILRYGKGDVRQNKGQAFKLYKKAAATGDPEAMTRFGSMIYQNEYGKDPIDLGIIWLKKAMDANYNEAFFEYGKLLLPNTDPESKINAYNAFEKVQHIPEAKYLLGKMKIKGDGTQRSVSGGMMMIKEASKMGYIPAIYSMGIGYRENKNGVKTNIKRAYESFQKCAEAEYHPGEYQFAYMIENGIGCQKDVDKAIKYYKRAADGGEAKAMFNLGLIYDKNKKYHNTEQAIKYYQEAADKGIKEAFFNLGMIYKDGEDIEKDITKAKEYLATAADKGVVNAQFWSYKINKDSDMTTAIKYLQMAADNEHGKAMCILGNFLVDGVNVEKDVNQGISYLAKAASLIYGD